METNNQPGKGRFAVYLFISFLLVQPVTSQNTASEEMNSGSVERYTGPIIDMHLHSYSNDFWGPAPNPATGNPSASTAGEQMEQTFKVMQEYNVA